MTSDETTPDVTAALPYLVQGPLAVHRLDDSGSPGELLGQAHTVTATAALLGDAPDPDSVVEALDADRPEPPAGPLVLVDAAGTAVPVLEIHTSAQTPSIALEVADPVLHVDAPAGEAPLTLPGRSIWCKLFPRMRGC